MFAIVKDNQVVKIGEIKQLFPNISFPASGPDGVWRQENDVKEVVDGERKDERFYFVTSITPTYDNESDVVRAGFQSTAKQLEDEDAVDQEGNPIFVTTYDPVTKETTTTTERVVNKGLKSTWISQIKETANRFLAPTDWMVVRKFERNVDIPQATQTYRQAVVTEVERLETAIAAAQDVDALAAVVNDQRWPK